MKGFDCADPFSLLVVANSQLSVFSRAPVERERAELIGKKEKSGNRLGERERDHAITVVLEAIEVE